MEEIPIEFQHLIDEITELIQNLNIEGPPSFESQLSNFEKSTLIRIKTLLISLKTLSELHNRLNIEFNFLKEHQTGSKGINSMMDQLAENLRKLEETQVKELIDDVVERFLSNIFRHPRDPSVSTLKFTSAEDILNFFAPIASEELIEKLNTELNNRRTEETTRGETPSLSSLLNEKNQKINALENEVQSKIRELEALKSDFSRFEDLENEIQALRSRNSELEANYQSQKTEFSILTNENKLFQSRFQEINTDLTRKNQEITELRAELSELGPLKEKLEETEKKLETLTDEKEQIGQSLSKFQQKCSFLDSNLQNFKDQSLQLQRDKQELMGTLQIRENRIQELQDDLDAKQQDLVHLRESSEQSGEGQEGGESVLSSTLVEKELLISDLKQELHQLNEKIQHMVFRDKYNALAQKLEETENILIQKNQYLQDKTQLIQQVKEEFKGEKDELISKIETLQEKISQQENLEEKLREKEEIIEDFQKQEEEFHEALLDNVKLTAEKEDIQEKINELIEQKEVLFNRISDIKRKNSGSAAIIARLQKQIDGLESQAKVVKELSPSEIKDNIEKEMLQKQVDTLNAELREQIVQASEANGKFQVIKDQFEQSKKELKEIKDDLDLTRQENNNLKRKSQEQKVEYSEKLAEIERKLNISERKVGELETELLRSQDTAQYIAEIDQLKQELEDKTQSALQLNESLIKAQSEMALGKKEIFRLNEEIVNLKRRIKLLRRDIQQQPSDL